MNELTQVSATLRGRTRRTLHRRLAAAIAIAGALAIAGCQSGQSLAGPTWQWTAQQQTNALGQAVAADPETYTLVFRTNGTVSIQADCHTLAGTYTVGVPLDLTIVVSAPAEGCGAASLDRAYLESLARVTNYATDGGVLSLYFGDDGGGMRFTNQGS